MGEGIIIVGAIVAAAVLLWLEPFTMPGWPVVAFVLVLVLMSVALTATRVRRERRLARALWHALTGK